MSQTSCEGYVSKLGGRFVKNWKHRYLVLNGDALTLKYYESKTAMVNGKPAKGEFQFTNLKTDTFDQTHPIGFTAIGHSAKHGFTEFHVAVDTKANLSKWIQIGKNALNAKASKLSTSCDLGKEAKMVLGVDHTVGKQDSVKGHQANTDDLVHHALKQIVEANSNAAATCTELQTQSEILGQAQDDLDDTMEDLDKGDRLLHKMEHPLMHFLHGHHHGVSIFHHKTKVTKDSNVVSSPTKVNTKIVQGDDDLAMLSKALAELSDQGEAIRNGIQHTTKQLDTIQASTNIVTQRVDTQSATAKKVLNTGNVF